jgi:hypothetical protein
MLRVVSTAARAVLRAVDGWCCSTWGGDCLVCVITDPLDATAPSSGRARGAGAATQEQPCDCASRTNSSTWGAIPT